MRLNRLSKFAFVAALSIACSFAATPTIGVASAVGTFVVNSAEVEGNANLFDGSQIKTSKASSQILLQNGSTLTLGVDSSGTIYRDRLLLERGTTKVSGMNRYAVEAGSYRIEGTEPLSQAIVRLEGDTVEVAAVNGSLRVLDARGALLTRIGAGTASAFQSGATAGQSGASTQNNNEKKKLAALILFLGGSLAGLGLAVDAILQPTSP
jgi:hypothetical protein